MVCALWCSHCLPFNAIGNDCRRKSVKYWSAFVDLVVQHASTPKRTDSQCSSFRILCQCSVDIKSYCSDKAVLVVHRLCLGFKQPEAPADLEQVERRFLLPAQNVSTLHAMGPVVKAGRHLSIQRQLARTDAPIISSA
eukprot:782608-Pelagomonas_calceolata.AAC.1